MQQILHPFNKFSHENLNFPLINSVNITHSVCTNKCPVLFPSRTRATDKQTMLLHVCLYVCMCVCICIIMSAKETRCAMVAVSPILALNLDPSPFLGVLPCWWWNWLHSTSVMKSMNSKISFHLSLYKIVFGISGSLWSTRAQITSKRVGLICKNSF